MPSYRGYRFPPEIISHEPRRLVTDKLGSYAAAHRRVMPSVPHDTSRHANNGLKSPTSLPDCESDRCGGSSLPLRRLNDSEIGGRFGQVSLERR